jgi:hypothetical protein
MRTYSESAAAQFAPSHGPISTDTDGGLAEKNEHETKNWEGITGLSALRSP